MRLTRDVKASLLLQRRINVPSKSESSKTGKDAWEMESQTLRIPEGFWEVQSKVSRLLLRSLKSHCERKP